MRSSDQKCVGGRRYASCLNEVFDGLGENGGLDKSHPSDCTSVADARNPLLMRLLSQAQPQFTASPLLRRQLGHAIRSKTSSQSPHVFWRNNRIVGYHGLSSRSISQRQSAATGIATQIGTRQRPGQVCQ